MSDSKSREEEDRVDSRPPQQLDELVFLLSKDQLPELCFFIIIIMTIFNEETFSLKSGLQKGPRKLKIYNE